ncbi:MAG: PQQ-binding-like beta-propeller repeat protein [Acidobacteria bacterium]|nr:PQQ-binding-like beta-propeller repeat protein [Acidobacteriota bacterium]
MITTLTIDKTERRRDGETERRNRFAVSLSLYLSFSLSLCLSAHAQNWPQFRGERAGGVADGKPVPTKWDVEKDENIAWKVAIPGLAHASPVVWEDRIYIATAVSADEKPFFKAGPYGDVDSVNETAKYTWRVMALDKKTGKVIWDKVAAEGLPKIKRHTKATHANSTPATDGKNIVVFFGTEGGLYCFDKKGKLKWKQDLGALDSGWFFDADYQWGTATSPIIYKNLVILQVDVQQGSYIAAWDLKSGKQVWKTERAEIPSWGTPTIVESKTRVELVTNATKAARGYDPLTGKELWSLKGQPEVTSTTPIAGHDLIFISNSYRPNQPVYAIKQGAANGDISLSEGKTSNDAVAWSVQRGGSYQPSPIIYGEYLYVCNNNGTLNVYNAKTGERAYQKRVSEKGSSYSGSPVAANGNLYFPNEDGDIVVIKAGATYELVSQNPMGEVLMATPAISDGMIFVRGQKHLFAIAEKPMQAAQK